jgi:hypothetical protein
MYNMEIYCTCPYCIENMYCTRRLRRLVQYGFSIITTGFVSLNPAQARYTHYNINRLLYSVMYNMEIYCTSRYCIENPHWTRRCGESNTDFQYNTDEYNIFQYYDDEIKDLWRHKYRKKTVLVKKRKLFRIIVDQLFCCF